MGKLIVIEGLDGSGKQTQTKMLFDYLKRSGQSVKKVSFPDYNEPSSSLAKMYLNGEFGTTPEDVNAYAASSFFAVDRYASYIKFWKSFYKGGGIILADRYTTSNAVYHMSKLPKNEWENYLNWLEDYEYNKIGIPRPDIVIYLDVNTQISQKLLSNRYGGNESKKDLHEKDCTFLETCKESAYFAANKLKWEIVKCVKNNNLMDKEEIHSCVIESIGDRGFF